MTNADIIGDVLDEVSAFYGVKVEDIISHRRTQRILPARHAAIYLARKFSGAEAQDIGRRFGGRDYTTVLMTCRAVQRLIEQNSQAAQVLSGLEERCRRNFDSAGT